MYLMPSDGIPKFDIINQSINQWSWHRQWCIAASTFCFSHGGPSWRSARQGRSLFQVLHNMFDRSVHATTSLVVPQTTKEVVSHRRPRRLSPTENLEYRNAFTSIQLPLRVPEMVKWDSQRNGNSHWLVTIVNQLILIIANRGLLKSNSSNQQVPYTIF